MNTPAHPAKPLSNLLSVAWMLVETGLAYAAIQGVEGAKNIIVIISAFGIPIAILGCIALMSQQELPRTQPRWVVVVANLCDISIILMLGWNGWMWCTAAWMFGFIVCLAFREKIVLQPTHTPVDS